MRGFEDRSLGFEYLHPCGLRCLLCKLARGLTWSSRWYDLPLFSLLIYEESSYLFSFVHSSSPIRASANEHWISRFARRIIIPLEWPPWRPAPARAVRATTPRRRRAGVWSLKPCLQGSAPASVESPPAIPAPGSRRAQPRAAGLDAGRTPSPTRRTFLSLPSFPLCLGRAARMDHGRARQCKSKSADNGRNQADVPSPRQCPRCPVQSPSGPPPTTGVRLSRGLPASSEKVPLVRLPSSASRPANSTIAFIMTIFC